MNDIEAFAPLAARVLDGEGVTAERTGPGYTALLQMLVQANKELAAMDLARLRGGFGYLYNSAAFRANLMPMLANGCVSGLGQQGRTGPIAFVTRPEPYIGFTDDQRESPGQALRS